MLQGVGVDIVSLKRIEQSINNSGNVFLESIFTDYEIEQSKSHSRPIAYFAGRFAAKEAIFKLFKIDWETGVKLKEIEIRDGPHGEPIPILSGRFAEIAQNRGVNEILLSISNEDEYAVCVAAMQ